MNKEDFLTLSEVLDIIPISRSTLYLMMQRKEFPRPIKISPRRVVWGRKRVNEWLQHRLSLDKEEQQNG